MRTYANMIGEMKGRSSRTVPGVCSTRIVERGDNIALVYHETDVVTWSPDGWVTLNSGGWRTLTTKARINEWAGARVYSDKGIWYLGSDATHEGQWGQPRSGRVVFADGMQIHAVSGKIRGAGRRDADLREMKWRKRVKEFAREYVEKMKAGDVGRPGPGDC